jgi:hypothetical protein
MRTARRGGFERWCAIRWHSRHFRHRGLAVVLPVPAAAGRRVSIRGRKGQRRDRGAADHRQHEDGKKTPHSYPQRSTTPKGEQTRSASIEVVLSRVRRDAGFVLRSGHIGLAGVAFEFFARNNEPTEKVDTKILETLVELDAGADLPDGLRVDAFIVPANEGNPVPAHLETTVTEASAQRPPKPRR